MKISSVFNDIIFPSYKYQQNSRKLSGFHQDVKGGLSNVDLAAGTLFNINKTYLERETNMTHFKTLIIATAAIISIAGTASAGEPTFQASFTIDKSASTDMQYASFQATAKASCKDEAIRAGYRATESNSWEREKCERQLIKRAVKATKSKSLIAFHNNSVGGLVPTRKYASSK